MQVQRQTAFLQVSLERLCIYVVIKGTGEIVDIPYDDDISRFVTEYILKGFIKSRKRIDTFKLAPDATAKQLLETHQSNNLCTATFELARNYLQTSNSRTALILVAEFRFNGRRFVGFF